MNEIKTCKWCGSSNLKFKERPDTPHFGQMLCGHCQKHSHWVKSPLVQRNNLRTNKKTISEIAKFHGMNEEFCFFCLRERDKLGKQETLTIDHIKELDKGGEDQIWNMQILCTACHKLKNWSRLHMNWHFN